MKRSNSAEVPPLEAIPDEWSRLREMRRDKSNEDCKQECSTHEKCVGPEETSPDMVEDEHGHMHFRPLRMKCTHCDEAFSKTHDLYAHIRSHQNHTKCPYCDKILTCMATFVYHVRTHTGEKPYYCPVPGCDFRNAVKYNLKVHLACVKHGGKANLKKYAQVLDLDVCERSLKKRKDNSVHELGSRKMKRRRKGKEYNSTAAAIVHDMWTHYEPVLWSDMLQYSYPYPFDYSSYYLPSIPAPPTLGKPHNKPALLPPLPKFTLTADTGHSQAEHSHGGHHSLFDLPLGGHGEDYATETAHSQPASSLYPFGFADSTEFDTSTDLSSSSDSHRTVSQ